jgi:O-antigen ligase/polysaccharide polymerase Wzy-like membrane protein
VEHPDLAQAAAIVGAAGAAIVLVARARLPLLAGLALLAAAELAFGVATVGSGDLDRLVSPASIAAGAAGSVLLAAAVAALVRWSAAVVPVVLAAAPFRLPVDVDTGNRLLFSVAESGELGRLLPLYAVLAAATLALAVRSLRGDDVPALPRTLAYPAAAFVALAAVSLLWSRDVEAGGGVLAFFLLPFAAIVAVVGRAPFAPWLPRVLAVVSVALATAFALIGLYQAATEELLFFAPNLEVANTYAPIFRVTSLFRDPSLYGRHLVLGIAVLVVALWLRRVRPLSAAALVAVLWAGLYFSYSQSSLTALFVVVLAISAAAGNRRVRAAVAVTAGVLVLAGGLLVAREAADTSLRRATSDRSRRVELTARVFAERPLAGVGIGAQPFASQALSERFGPEPAFVSHTTPLTVGAELGVAGLSLYALLLVGAGAAIEGVRRRDEALGLGLAAALLALFVHSLFYSGFFEDPITWLVLGVAASFLVARQTAESPVAPVAAQRPLVAAR